jgi:hypothetical protein
MADLIFTYQHEQLEYAQMKVAHRGLAPRKLASVKDLNTARTAIQQPASSECERLEHRKLAKKRTTSTLHGQQTPASRGGGGENTESSLAWTSSTM